MPDALLAMPEMSIQWEQTCALVNLRIGVLGEPLRQALDAQQQVLLPTLANTTLVAGRTRCVWAGPDDWFVLDTACTALKAPDLIARLQPLLQGTHHAITDVSSGYRVLTLRGPAARELLAQGCPLDLHPRSFQTGMSAGTHYFKASVWLWQIDEVPIPATSPTLPTPPHSPTFQLMVRRSFAPYVHLMLQKTSREHGSLPDYRSDDSSG